ncbi:hypothetical protein BJY52DRAFT_1225328 [Lactarius psammicola]|nr:hypothetical protein BJY52DRAFT_1225328 [Lactarius psammicola]
MEYTGPHGIDRVDSIPRIPTPETSQGVCRTQNVLRIGLPSERQECAVLTRCLLLDIRCSLSTPLMSDEDQEKQHVRICVKAEGETRNMFTLFSSESILAEAAQVAKCRYQDVVNYEDRRQLFVPTLFTRARDRACRDWPWNDYSFAVKRLFEHVEQRYSRIRSNHFSKSLLIELSYVLDTCSVSWNAARLPSSPPGNLAMVPCTPSLLEEKDVLKPVQVASFSFSHEKERVLGGTGGVGWFLDTPAWASTLSYARCILVPGCVPIPPVTWRGWIRPPTHVKKPEARFTSGPEGPERAWVTQSVFIGWHEHPRSEYYYK